MLELRCVDFWQAVDRPGAEGTAIEKSDDKHGRCRVSPTFPEKTFEGKVSLSAKKQKMPGP